MCTAEPEAQRERRGGASGEREKVDPPDLAPDGGGGGGRRAEEPGVHALIR
jgi:hypothetical protein